MNRRTASTHTTTQRRARAMAIRGLGGLAVLALVLGACAGDDSFDSGVSGAGDASDGGFDGAVDEMADDVVDDMDGDMAAPEEGPRDAGEMEDQDAEQETAPSNGNGATAAANTGRRVIRTATLELEVEDTAEAADRIVAIATDAGGFVAETDLQRDREGVVRGSITLRVPTAALFDTVEALDELAVAVPVRRIDERDVTAQTTDLRAQRDNLRAYETELNALLTDVRDSAERADELLVVFERIREVRFEIDRLDAQLASLGDQVALATITVGLRPAPSALPVTDPTWSAGETIRDALTATARALTGIADGAIRLLLTVLPIALLLTAPILIPIVWIWRRQHRRGRSGPPPVGGGDGSGGDGGSGGDDGDGNHGGGATDELVGASAPTAGTSATSPPSGDGEPAS
jgi:hypothetical protein